jgi:hypothetical protein
MRAPDLAGLFTGDMMLTNSAGDVSAAQSLAYYPKPYTASPSYSMMQTPWYLDYSHLVFWFFFFSTFVLVV